MEIQDDSGLVSMTGVDTARVGVWYAAIVKMVPNENVSGIDSDTVAASSYGRHELVAEGDCDYCYENCQGLVSAARDCKRGAQYPSWDAMVRPFRSVG